MYIFPDWADLGDPNTSRETRGTWEAELARANEYFYYFSGEVFNERVTDADDLSNEDAPLMYPVGLNLVKMLALAHADAMFGDWEDMPVRFQAVMGKKPDATIEAGIELANQILIDSAAPRLFWELELQRQVFGGGALQIVPDFSKPSKIKWALVPKGSFYPVWDPENEDKLLSVHTYSQITQEQARLAYGFESSKDWIIRVEKWTPFEHTFMLDGHVIPVYSGINPYGIVPFVYIPRYRFSNWFGEAITSDLIDPQNELNMRVADLGEAINYNSHPTRWGVNLPSDFNADNYTLGINSMWDLGRAIGNSPEPKVGVLQVENPIPKEAFDYIHFIYDWARTSTFAPPIAFGEDEGGSQRSGVTLEIRLWPLLKSIKRSRSYMAAGLQSLVQKTAFILKQKAFDDISPKAIKAFERGDVAADFHKILPRDQAAIVDEVVKLNSTSPPSISLMTAQEILGRGPGEVDRIVEQLQDERFQSAMEQLIAGANPDEEGESSEKDKKDNEENKEKDET